MRIEGTERQSSLPEYSSNYNTKRTTAEYY